MKAVSVPDLGLKLARKGISLIIRNVSQGGELTNDHLLEFAALTRANLLAKASSGASSTVEILQDQMDTWLRRSTILSPAPSVADDTVFKSMPRDQARRWAEGCVTITPFHTERAQTQPLELLAPSLGSFALSHGRKHAYLELIGGFNVAAIYCSRTPPASDEETSVVRISRFNELMSLLSEHFDNSTFVVRDLLYSDLKVFRKRTPLASAITKMLARGPLTEAAIFQLYEEHADELLGLAEMPAVFCKPGHLGAQRERCGALRYSRDTMTAFEIIDPRIAELIEVVG